MIILEGKRKESETMNDTLKTEARLTKRPYVRTTRHGRQQQRSLGVPTSTLARSSGNRPVGKKKKKKKKDKKEEKQQQLKP